MVSEPLIDTASEWFRNSKYIAAAIIVILGAIASFRQSRSVLTLVGIVLSSVWVLCVEMSAPRRVIDILEDIVEGRLAMPSTTELDTAYQAIPRRERDRENLPKFYDPLKVHYEEYRNRGTVTIQTLGPEVTDTCHGTDIPLKGLRRFAPSWKRFAALCYLLKSALVWSYDLPSATAAAELSWQYGDHRGKENYDKLAALLVVRHHDGAARPPNYAGQ